MFCLTGLTGDVRLDENADRVPSYWLWDYRPEQKIFQPFAYMSLNNNVGIWVRQFSILLGVDTSKVFHIYTGRKMGYY